MSHLKPNMFIKLIFACGALHLTTAFFFEQHAHEFSESDFLMHENVANDPSFETKPVQRDKNHEIYGQKPYAIYLYHKHCSEHALRDAMHIIYPHRIEHSTETHREHEHYRNTRWSNRRHLYVHLTPQRLIDVHTHPCIEKVVPLFYEAFDVHDWFLHQHAQKATEAFHEYANADD